MIFVKENDNAKFIYNNKLFFNNTILFYMYSDIEDLDTFEISIPDSVSTPTI